MPYSADVREFYSRLVFGFTLSPAMGTLIIGGVALSIVGLLLRSIRGGRDGDSAEAGFAPLYLQLWREVLSDGRLLAITIILAGFLGASAYALNPFSPLSPTFSLLFCIYAIFLGWFVELVLLVRMVGETGMSMGIFGIVLYDLPVFFAGYRAYSGYMAGHMFIPSPWVAPSVIGLLKYREKMGISLREIVLGKAAGWTVSLVVSAATTLLLWRHMGFGTLSMPAVGLLQQAVYIDMLARGHLRYA